jgi:drug/metabolite transporter (DMT)-like permease
LLEPESITWTPAFVGAMAWALALTLGGSSLFYFANSAALRSGCDHFMYSVPPTTALMAWLLFGEAIT